VSVRDKYGNSANGAFEAACLGVNASVQAVTNPIASDLVQQEDASLIRHLRLVPTSGNLMLAADRIETLLADNARLHGLLQESWVKLFDVQGTTAPKRYACNLIARIQKTLETPNT